MVGIQPLKQQQQQTWDWPSLAAPQPGAGHKVGGAFPGLAAPDFGSPTSGGGKEGAAQSLEYLAGSHQHHQQVLPSLLDQSPPAYPHLAGDSSELYSLGETEGRKLLNALDFQWRQNKL
jgi:hypothetical protein